MIEGELKGVFGRVEFSLDGNTVSCVKEHVSENKMNIVVHINGEIKGVWIGRNPEWDFVKKVFAQKRHSSFKPKEKQGLIESFGKRRAKEIFPNLDEVTVFYSPFFSVAGSLVRQYSKLEGLEIVSIG